MHLNWNGKIDDLRKNFEIVNVNKNQMSLNKWQEQQRNQIINQLRKTLEHPIHHNQSNSIPTVNY